jgi:3-methyladenine DNA glycosylase AlkC
MPEPFKNMYNHEFLDNLAAALYAAFPQFDRNTFLTRIYDDQWERRELKQRMRHITLTMGSLLPNHYHTALAIIRQAAASLNQYGFQTIVFPDFVEVYGLDDWEASLPAIEQFTQQSSAEFAVRPFIVRDQQRMMAQMLQWTGHSSHHVRRLASEGCRPRLPWAMALPAFKTDPSPILPILEKLKQDKSDFVRRSVANNLNDIAKDNPQFVLDVVRRWQVHDTMEMRTTIRHALRTLVKQGNIEALELLGFPGKAIIRLKRFTVEPTTVSIGGQLTLSFEIESLSDSPQNLMIDCVVYHMKANGQLTPKVFKLTKALVAPGQVVRVARKHSFRPVTTRRYYPGEHAIALQVNGVVFKRETFTLTASSKH